MDLNAIVAAGQHDVEPMHLATPPQPLQDDFEAYLMKLDFEDATDKDLADINMALVHMDELVHRDEPAPPAPSAPTAFQVAEPYVVASNKPLLYRGLVVRRTRQPNEQPMVPVTFNTLKNRIFGVNPTR